VAKKIDLRKTLRAIAQRIQDANAQRLVSSEAVAGGALEPRRSIPQATTSRRRLRILGERRALAELAGAVGIATGDMLKDLVRRANIKLGRTGFKITPSSSEILKTRVFTAGDRHQAARPFSGITREQLEQAAGELVQDLRSQVVEDMNDREKP